MIQKYFPEEKAKAGDKVTIEAHIPLGLFRFPALVTEVDSKGDITNLRITAEPQEAMEDSIKNKFKIGQQLSTSELDKLASITALWNSD